MEIGEARQPRQLGDYLGFARRQWLVFLVAIFLGVDLAVGLLLKLPETFSSSASVLIKATSVNSESTDARTTGAVNMDTEAQVVKALPVASAVKTQLKSPLTEAELARRVTVSVPPNTTIISIAYASPTPQGAQSGAEAFASGYLEYRSTQAREQVAAQREVLIDKRTKIDTRIRTLNRRLESLEDGSAARKNAQQALISLQRRSAAVDALLLPLETAQTDAGAVIDLAPLPSKPVKPNKTLIFGSSLALLLLLGLAVAWWRDRHLGRIRLVREIESEPSVEVLGMLTDTKIPGSTIWSRGRGSRLSSLQQYRQIVHAIQARLDGPGGAVLVTGVGSSAAAQQVAYTLGMTVVRTGFDVTLIYSDQHTATHFAERQASADVSPGELHAQLSTTSLEQADLMVAGNVQTRELAAYLEGSGGRSGLSLLSTPPVGLSADAQAVAPYVHLAVLVLELNRSTHSELSDALRQLRQVGTSTVGAIAVSSRTRPAKRRTRGPGRTEGDRQSVDVDEPASDVRTRTGAAERSGAGEGIGEDDHIEAKDRVSAAGSPAPDDREEIVGATRLSTPGSKRPK